MTRALKNASSPIVNRINHERVKFANEYLERRGGDIGTISVSDALKDRK